MNNGTASLTYSSLSADLGGSSEVARGVDENNLALAQLDSEEFERLTQHLVTRLQRGKQALNERIVRYSKIDRAISTWQQLDAEDSERGRLEETTGKQYAIPFNLPILASHLDDVVSYFAEALAPISNPFSATTGDQMLAELTKRLNKDALSRDYYGELTLTLRAMLKYNIGGMLVEWDAGGEGALGVTGIQQEGNHWQSLDPYNTFWDTSLANPRHLPWKGEYGGVTRLTNRYEMLKKAIAGEWVGLDDILKADRAQDHVTDAIRVDMYYNPEKAIPGRQGEDSRVSKDGKTVIDDAAWARIGLDNSGVSDEGEPQYSLTKMYCWIVPKQFGLLDETTESQLADMGKDPDLYLALWRFELVDGGRVVSAYPVPQSSPDARNSIPMFLSYMTQDQLLASQRSAMELMRGFQRFASAMHSIYVEGMRGNVWGLQVYDPAMFDLSSLKPGETSGRLAAKINNRDVRTGIHNVQTEAAVGEVMRGVAESLQLKDQLFPGQALPSQISGMDRAVTSQVASVVQGGQRSLRMLLRLLDSAMMMPTRMAAVRNIQQFDSQVGDAFNEITDEDVAKALGSGVESMEAERISEHFWRLLMAIVQNPESSQLYNVPAMLAYLGRLMNLSVNMEDFARPPPQTPPQAPPGPEQ